jgi:hypothetical protein
MNWFFCMDDADDAFRLARVAVATALRNTSLVPNCLYYGDKMSQIDWLESNGVNVIRHSPDSIKKSILGRFWGESKYVGWYLRADIPIFCQEDKILYTDIDVVFTGDCQSLHDICPRFLAAAPQEDPMNIDWFNSGVLFLNGPQMAATRNDFIDFSKREMNVRQLSDQAAYNDFYGRRYDLLPIEYNWKAYWGKNEADWETGYRRRSIPIQIIHFHGPKPWNTSGWPDIYFNDFFKERAAEWMDIEASL